jgi:HlyD family secretion protein
MNLKFRLRPFLIWGAVILAAGFVGYKWYAAKNRVEIVTVEVKRGDVVEEVTETGTVVASRDVELYFKDGGRVAEVLAVEGQKVKAGDPIMRLDTAQLATRRREAAAAVTSAEARYAQALAGATVEELRVLEATVRNAETALEGTRQALTDTVSSNESTLSKAYSDLSAVLESLNVKAASTNLVLSTEVFDASGALKTDFAIPDGNAGSRATDSYQKSKTAQAQLGTLIAQLRAQTDRAQIDALAASILVQAGLTRDAAQYANAAMQAAVVAGSTTQAALDVRKTNVKNAWSDMTNSVTGAEGQLLALASVKSTNAASYNAASAKVTAAAGALDSARDQLASRSAPLREVDKAVYLSATNSARAALELVDRQIADALLTAPADGIIGNVDIGLGEIVRPNVAVGTLISPHLQIESDVSELDIAGIRPDQPARFTFDAIEGRTFTGRVQSVAPRETAKDDDVYYKVTIAIEGEEPDIRIGMTADIDIEVGRKAGVLLAPRRQVYRREGKDYVKIVAENGKIEEIEVVVGLRGRDAYEILSGLRETDRILVE